MNGLRPKASAKDDAYRLGRYVYPVIGKMPVADVTEVRDYLRPAKGKGKPKLFGYLYPSELLALLKCQDVQIGRRVLYALAVYTGLRKGSLLALAWGGVDFEHGTLTSLKSKTGLPQMF